MKPIFNSGQWFGLTTGVLVGLLMGIVLSGTETLVPTLSSVTWAQSGQTTRDLKMDLLIDSSGDKVISRILNLERQLKSLTMQLAAYENATAKSKDLQALRKRQMLVETQWGRELKKLEHRLRVNEDALEKLCSGPKHDARIRRPGIPTALLGSACDGYEPAR